MTSPQPLLEVRALTLGIGRRTLIRNLSMCVQAGEVWCILGVNGVGKTMFLNTLVGLRRVESGVICFSGKACLSAQPRDRWSVMDAARLRGFLPQTIHDAFSAPVLDIVLMGRHPHLSRWGWEGEAEREIAVAALHAVGLAALAGRDITTLSGGERQRAAIAALLAQDAPLLLMDEPTTHLDLHHQIMILRHLVRLARDRDKALMFSIHDLNLAFRFATHAMLFREDGVVDIGPINEVMNDAALSRAFRYPVVQMQAGRQTVFVAN